MKILKWPGITLFWIAGVLVVMVLLGAFVATQLDLREGDSITVYADDVKDSDDEGDDEDGAKTEDFMSAKKNKIWS